MEKNVISGRRKAAGTIYLVILAVLAVAKILPSWAPLEMSKIEQGVVFHPPIIIPTSPWCAFYAQEWNQTWGTTLTDQASSVALDTSGNIYVAAVTNGFGAGNYDAVLIKYDPTGTIIWNTTWGAAGIDAALEVAVDTSGNAYIAGYTNSSGAGGDDAFVAKFDATGNQLWNQTWGGVNEDHARGLTTDGSTSVYIVGYTLSFGAGYYDAFINKYDNDGTLLWNRTWGIASYHEDATSVAVDGSGNVFLAGYLSSPTVSQFDSLLVQYNSSGTQLWNRTWGGSNYDYGYDVAVDASGNAFIAGTTNSFGAGNNDGFLLKYSGGGTQLWNRLWGGTSFDNGMGVALDTSGNVYLTGYTLSYGAGSYDAFLSKYKTNGTNLWNRTWGGTNQDRGNDVAVDSSGNAVLVGDTISFGAGGLDAFIATFPHVPPPIIINAPLAGSTFGAAGLNFNVTADDPELNNSWYRIANSPTNHSFTPGSIVAVDAADWAAQPNGTVVLHFWANDTQGDLGYSNISINKDIIEPSITVDTPAPWQLDNETAPTFSLSIMEANLDTIWYSLDGGITNTVCGLAGTLAEQWSSIGNGTVIVTFWANDSLGNIGSASITVQKDITQPSFFGTGLNLYQLCGVTAPSYSLAVTEANLDQTWYSLDSGVTNTTCGLSGTLVTQWGSYGNGTVTITFWANDTLGNVGSTSVTVRKDIIAPSIVVNAPALWQLCNVTAPAYSLAVTEANLDQTWYSLDSGVTNTTCGLSGTLVTQWGSYGNGTVTITFWANDTLGNVGSTSIKILKDATLPTITSTGLVANKLCGPTPPEFNLTVIGDHLDTTWYSLNGGGNNITCVSNQTVVVDAAQWGAWGNGTVTIMFWANGTLGNTTYTSVLVFKDIIAPSFTGTGLTPNQLCGAVAPSFSLMLVDGNFNAAWYSLDGGLTNTTCSLGGTLAAQWASIANGSVTVTFWANDTLGNVGYTSATVQKDIIAPSFTGTGLSPGQLCNATAPLFSLTVVDDNFNATWYSLDGGLTNTTCSLGSTLVAQWSSMGNGTVTVTFWANDTLGNIGSTSVAVQKDIMAPIFTATGLAPNQLCGVSAPAFSLGITEANLDQIWYSLDGGLTNTTCSLGGTLAAQWSSTGNGTVTVTFWGIDSMDNVGTTSLIILKDIIAPIITVNAPAPGQECNAIAPSFSLTVVGDLAAMWYSLDGGTTNYTIADLSGTINTTAWEACPVGSVTITFWVNDTQGNIGTTTVVVTKVILSGITPSNNDTILIIITVIGIAAAAAATAIIYYRRKTSAASRKFTEAQLSPLSKLFQNKREVKLGEAAKVLHVPREEIVAALIEWKSELPTVRLDGDHIIVDGEGVGTVITQLNAIFEDWKVTEVSNQEIDYKALEAATFGDLPINLQGDDRQQWDRMIKWMRRAQNLMAEQKGDAASILWKMVNKIATEKGWITAAKLAEEKLRTLSGSWWSGNRDNVGTERKKQDVQDHETQGNGEKRG